MKLVKRLVPSAIFIYLGVVIGMMFLERAMIYPAPSAAGVDWYPDWLDFEEVEFESLDGTPLHGWYLEHSAPTATVLIFHGNGEHVAHMAGELQNWREQFNVSVMAFDYRGYGKSQGKPFERGLLEDGTAAQAWLAARTGQPMDAMVLLGRSIGGAVAVQAAAKNGARGLILDRTFDSLVNVAAHHMRFLPVRWLLRNRFPSAERIRGYTGPLLQLHGEADQVIPIQFGKSLFEAAPSPQKKLLTYKTLGHNDPWPAGFQQELHLFLESLPDRAGRSEVRSQD